MAVDAYGGLACTLLGFCRALVVVLKVVLSCLLACLEQHVVCAIALYAGVAPWAVVGVAEVRSE